MNNSKKPKILVIAGPTASGKSDLGIKLACKFNGEIISADSRQVYRGMDIGTGKVQRDSIKYQVLSIKERERKSEYYSSGVRHHLIDVANPKKQFTADDFKWLGQKAIDDILNRGKLPIVVGGTGFYIDVLLGRLSVAEVPPNKKLRAELEKQSVEQLLKRLEKLDPQRAKIIDPKNKRRLTRALEVVMSTGEPVPQAVLNIKYQALWLGLKPKNIEQRIKKRLDERLSRGMLKEVQKLRQQGTSWKRLNDLGLEYRWISRWLRSIKGSVLSIKDFKDSEEYRNLLRGIIRYSKRQMTWFTRPNFVERNLGGFKRNQDIHWIKNQKESENLIQSFL